ncbi:MAG: NAD-dependent epimerase/dehydratase family protein [Patescibacteria group bacterium]
MSKKVIITGGAGFIGSHVTDLMVSEGYDVTVFDDLSTGVRSNINKQAKFIKIDITNFKKVNILVKKIKPICIFHLAAWPRIGRSMDDPIGTNNVNVNGTLVMLESARINKVPRFIFSSSSSIYGNQKTHRMNESMIPKPMSHYALQKLIGEKYATFYAESFGMKIISLRYFSVYGDRQPSTGAYALVIAKFLDQSKNKQTLTVFGDGNQTRDFTHVLDVAASNLLAMKAKVNSGTNTIVNIGASKETSVNQIAKMIGGDIEYIIPNPREKYEELRKMADNNLAKKLLKWVPQVDITEGISKLAPAA